MVCVSCSRIARTSGKFCAKCGNNLTPFDVSPASGAAALSLSAVPEEVETKAVGPTLGGPRPPPKDRSADNEPVQRIEVPQSIQPMIVEAAGRQIPLVV